jgi:Fic family protein
VLDRALQEADGILDVVSTKARFWERLAGVSVNERQRRLLNMMLDGFSGKLTSTKWATIAKCSQDTAHRDIVDLIEKGALSQDESGGRSMSYSLNLS